MWDRCMWYISPPNIQFLHIKYTHYTCPIITNIILIIEFQAKFYMTDLLEDITMTLQ